MDNMDKREYTPRRLHYLFVQGTKLDDGKDEEYIEDCREWDKEEEPVTYERHDTIFDGRKNNWSAWVSEQAKMFENMQQYAINLQLDVEDLNEQIEELMIACEEANCNVAQGYKMFKQLKELRLARKAKEEELDKVYAIIGCFDCAAMADTYRYLESIIYGEPEEKAGVLSLENAENTDEIREAM